MGQDPVDIKEMFSKAMNRFNLSGGSGAPSLTQFNLSSDELREMIDQKKLEVLSVVIVLVAIFGAYMLFTNRFKEVEGIGQQIKLLEEKESPVKEYEKVLAENKAYLKSLPPAIAENKFISELTSWAGQRNIKISSFEPPQTKVEGFYKQTSIRMTCTADGFRSAIQFLTDIERSKYALKIDYWNASVDTSIFPMPTSNNALSGRAKGAKIIMDLLVVSTELKEKASND